MSQYTRYVPLKNKLVTVRKDTHCSWCLGSIPKRTEARYIVGIWDGQFSTCYYHVECDAVTDLRTCTECQIEGAYERGSRELK